MILHELNLYHPNIKFIYELESNNKLAFLDVSARRANDNKGETSVYRKSTCTDIYINCHSHVPSNWKIGTLRNLIKRTKFISSSELLRRNEISYLRNIFTEYNNFPLKVVNNIIDQELSQLVQQETTKPQNKETQQLVLPYSGNQGYKLLSKIKKQLKKTLPEDVNTMISYKSTKLPTKFQVKTKLIFNIRIT